MNRNRNQRSIGAVCGCLLLSLSTSVFAQRAEDKFRQLNYDLRTPNVYRTASGAPGHLYWQQRADYDIEVELDDENQRITGTETVTYRNDSPDELGYIWLQLDQNMRAKDSDTYKTATNRISEADVDFKGLKRLHNDFDGGFKLEYVRDIDGIDLPIYVNKTMMRIDLPHPLPTGGSFVFNVKWWYNINDRMEIGGRSGYEYFEEDENYLYTIAQFFPRMTVYSEVEGWQNKQFLGSGEFTLPFGNYRVSITAPADHLIAATGELQNASEVLSSEQRRRLDNAKTAKEPVIIATQAEAEQREKTRSSDKKTWIFEAENVRDFAFASSRKFIWDALGVPFGDRTVMAMSFYPKEGNPLWEQYSTKVVAHTIRSYSKFTFDYPYPVAQSIHAKSIGMEYPMICFNFGRPEEDGTYTERTKYGMIGVIIHEVGHNYFPMIVNSDERQWTWMDEGLNTFVQYLTEQEWERDYPSRRGPPAKIVDYMKADNISPIMTNSESVQRLGPNAYAKPTTALNILRETVMGREGFDYAFKTYAQRWMFKHPTPDDFFRTMEDASGTDLDWFWRGWFYTTDNVDVSLDGVKWFQVDTKDPEVEKAFQREQEATEPEHVSETRNREEIGATRADEDPGVLDFYNDYDPLDVTEFDREEYEKFVSELDEDEKNLLRTGYNYYQLTFTNHGGLVSPLILEFEYTDGTKELERIPAEIWRRNAETVTKVFPTEKELKSVSLDPFLETADIDTSNNHWPPRAEPTRFQIFKEEEDEEEDKNPMQHDEKARRKSTEEPGY